MKTFFSPLISVITNRKAILNSKPDFAHSLIHIFDLGMKRNVVMEIRTVYNYLMND